DDGVGGGGQTLRRQFALDRGEGIVQRIHEQPAHHVDDEDLTAADRRIEAGAAAGSASGEIARPQQARMAIDEADGLALAPDMVARADDVDAGGVELVADLLGDAESGGGVLAVDDDEIELELAPQARHMLQHDVSTGSPDDIAAEEKAH